MEDNLEISENFSSLPNFGHRIQKCVMPIVGIKTIGDLKEYKFLGTGFMIGPCGLMMTAAHVVEDAKAYSLQTEDNVRYELVAMYITDEKIGKDENNVLVGPVPIYKLWHVEELDIAYIQTAQIMDEKGVAINFPVFQIDPIPPDVDTETLGFGYYQEKPGVPLLLDNAANKLEFKYNTAFTKGKVVELFPDYKYKFPCFTTDSKIPAGLSGSPIINQDGFVCGVATSSLTSELDSGHTSFISMVWPSLATEIEVLDEKTNTPVMKSVYKLCDEGYIAARNLNRIRIESANGNYIVSLQN